MNIHLFFRVPNRLLSIPPPLSTLKRVLLRNFSSSENRRFPLKHFTVFENHFKSLFLQHALRAKRATIIFSCLLSLCQLFVVIILCTRILALKIKDLQVVRLFGLIFTHSAFAKDTNSPRRNFFSLRSKLFSSNALLES